MLVFFVSETSLDELDVSDRPASNGACEVLQASVDEADH